MINIFITYFDEAGDDGYPAYSSPQFILSALYMKDENWKSNYELFYQFRKYLKERYNFPVKYEMHTKDFLLNKKPFTNMMSLDDKLSLIKDTCRFLAKKVNVQLVNVVIDKTAIKNSDYNVLDTALTYSVQRIENSIRCEGNERFLIITDEGRVGKMKNTTRRIQKFNYIPSKYNFNSEDALNSSDLSLIFFKNFKEKFIIRINVICVFFYYFKFFFKQIKIIFMQLHIQFQKKILY